MHEVEAPKSGLMDEPRVIKSKPRVTAQVAACNCQACKDPHFHMDDGRVYSIAAIR